MQNEKNNKQSNNQTKYQKKAPAPSDIIICQPGNEEKIYQAMYG
ncbi:MAG: hypothetical protein Q7T76_08400 [Ferruginibacter sp.]|nr:hypothetical protein [Ferruginibacter sp.]